MENGERGKVRNRSYYNQVRDFSGLRCGMKNTITPTDIDLFIEYENICYVCGELKFGDTSLEEKSGQRLALQRLCDDMSKIKPTIVIIANHKCGPDEDIDVSKTIVREMRFHGEWRPPKTELTTRELIDMFILYVKNKNHNTPVSEGRVTQ